MEKNKYSDKGFRFGILGIGLFLILVILSLLLRFIKYDFISLIIGLIVFAIAIVSAIGLINSIKGIKEPNTSKKIIGIILNLLLISFFLLVIFSGGYNIYKVLTNN